MEKIQEMVESVVAVFAEIPADLFDQVMQAAFKVCFPGPMKATQVKTKTDIGELFFDYEEPNSLWECIGADGVAKDFTHLANERRSTAASKFRASVDIKKTLKKAAPEVQAKIAAILKAAGLSK